MKYFYLLFSSNEILPLTDVVFNTEAHPFPRFTLGKLFQTGWQRKPRDAQGNIIPEAAPAVPKQVEETKDESAAEPTTVTQAVEKAPETQTQTQTARTVTEEGGQPPEEKEPARDPVTGQEKVADKAR